MHALAFINQKGGVGKTTSAVTVAAALARAGRQVLLLDNDPQGHVRKSLGIPDDAIRGGGMMALYEGFDTPLADVAQPARTEGHPHADQFGPERERLEVVLSALRLVNYEREVYLDEEGGMYRLAERAAEAEGRADVVVVDCPPNLGAFTLNALLFIRTLLDRGAGGGLVVPTGMSRLDVDGLVELIGVLGRLQRDEAAPEIAAIIPTNANAQTLMAQEVLASFHTAYEGKVTQHVRTTVRLKEATYRGLTIFEHDPGGIGAADYAQVARDLARILGMDDFTLE